MWLIGHFGATELLCRNLVEGLRWCLVLGGGALASSIDGEIQSVLSAVAPVASVSTPAVVESTQAISLVDGFAEEAVEGDDGVVAVGRSGLGVGEHLRFPRLWRRLNRCQRSPIRPLQQARYLLSHIPPMSRSARDSGFLTGQTSACRWEPRSIPAPVPRVSQRVRGPSAAQHLQSPAPLMTLAP
jgi:hypothetical protein